MAKKSGSSLGVTSMGHPQREGSHQGYNRAHDACDFDGRQNVAVGYRMRKKLPYQRDDSSNEIQREEDSKSELNPWAIGRLDPEPHGSLPLGVPPFSEQWAILTLLNQ